MSCGERIKKYLNENGIKYNFLSEKIGISPVTLGCMLNNKRKMTAEEYIQICEILNKSCDFFATEQ